MPAEWIKIVLIDHAFSHRFTVSSLCI